MEYVVLQSKSITMNAQELLVEVDNQVKIINQQNEQIQTLFQILNHLEKELGL